MTLMVVASPCALVLSIPGAVLALFDELPPGQRAGLVATNTIRQNDSREGSLDYIVKNGGTITEAVRSPVSAACSNPVFGAFISPE